MPSKSKKQSNLMRAAAHNPEFAKKAGIKPSVAKEFYAADKRTGKYQMGGLARANMGPQRPKTPRIGGGIPGTVPNGLLGTAQDHSQRLGDRLRRLQSGIRRPGGI